MGPSVQNAHYSQFSSISNTTPVARSGSRTSSSQLTSKLPTRHRCPRQFPNRLSAIRFASTIPLATRTDDLLTSSNFPSATPDTEIQSHHASAATTAPEAEFNTPETFDAFIDSGPEISEHIGFLKELGLDYGWGPTAMIEWLLEHVYIYTGLPWWGSIALTAVAVRIGLLKFYIDAADTNAKMQSLKPAMIPLMKRITQARKDQDRVELMKASQERYDMFKNADIKFYKIAIPLVQIPLGFGTFRLLRGMGYLPVPGFDHGGCLWFKDLTLPDPYGIMPVVTSISYFLAFRSGTNSGEVGAGMSPSTLALFQYIIPLVTGVFSLFFPAALQLTLFITSIFTVSQSYIFRQPGFRKFMNMHPILTPPKKGPPKPIINIKASRKMQAMRPMEQKKTGWAAVKQTMETAVNDLQKKSKEMQGQYVPDAKPARRSEAERKHAKAYEEKRQRELAQRRFESQQRRR
ncbi:MAG: hypothetical protein Q9217_004804 [Psora testacea]